MPKFRYLFLVSYASKLTLFDFLWMLPFKCLVYVTINSLSTNIFKQIKKRNIDFRSFFFDLKRNRNTEEKNIWKIRSKIEENILSVFPISIFHVYFFFFSTTYISTHFGSFSFQTEKSLFLLFSLCSKP